jgi:hypothetical protein
MNRQHWIEWAFCGLVVLLALALLLVLLAPAVRPVP